MAFQQLLPGGWLEPRLWRVAAVNMTGGEEAISTFHEGELSVNDKGELDSPFWDYD